MRLRIGPEGMLKPSSTMLARHRRCLTRRYAGRQSYSQNTPWVSELNAAFGHAVDAHSPRIALRAGDRREIFTILPPPLVFHDPLPPRRGNRDTVPFFSVGIGLILLPGLARIRVSGRGGVSRFHPDVLLISPHPRGPNVSLGRPLDKVYSTSSSRAI